VANVKCVLTLTADGQKQNCSHSGRERVSRFTRRFAQELRLALFPRRQGVGGDPALPDTEVGQVRKVCRGGRRGRRRHDGQHGGKFRCRASSNFSSSSSLTPLQNKFECLFVETYYFRLVYYIPSNLTEISSAPLVR
jgi:hypothetical protein